MEDKFTRKVPITIRHISYDTEYIEFINAFLDNVELTSLFSLGTGLTDKNGRDIYEHDTLAWYQDGTTLYGTVRWELDTLNDEFTAARFVVVQDNTFGTQFLLTRKLASKSEVIPLTAKEVFAEKEKTDD
jgi:hypothetical protein